MSKKKKNLSPLAELDLDRGCNGYLAGLIVCSVSHYVYNH
jgi:hypothetical protein